MCEAFGGVADAAAMLHASLDHLAAVDWASLGTQAHGEMLGQLQRTQAKLTAVNATLLSAFTAQSGYEPDGHKSARAWLVNKTGISKGAAGSSVGWQKRLGRHQPHQPAPAGLCAGIPLPSSSEASIQQASPRSDRKGSITR